jgi:branched-chain amino acid transport system permease protein
LNTDTALPRAPRLLLRSTPRNELVFIIVLGAFGFLLDDFYLDLLAGFLGLALLAVSLDLIWGYAGILSFGQATFFGIGGYVIGFTQIRWDFSLATAAGALLGVAAAAAAALVLGLFVFFSRVGLFFAAVITLAVSVLAEQVINQFSDVTGGFNGLILPTALPLSIRQYYLLSVAIFGTFLLFCVALVSSDFGRVLKAIRENEERTRFLGYASPWMKTLAFVIAGGIAGVGGILYAMQTGLVSPSYIGLALSTQAVVWVAIGGRGTLIGPAVGAILTNLFQHILSSSLLIYWQLALGMALIVIVVFAPDGLYAVLLRVTRRFDPGAHDRIDVQHDRQQSRRRRGAALETRAISKWFGSYRALTDVSVRLLPGELLCLIGPNGAGKSTLIDVITARTRPTAGEVLIDGRQAGTARPERVVRQGVARKFQASAIFDRLTVFDNVALARSGGRLTPIQLVRRGRGINLPAHVAALLKLGGLWQQMAKPAGDLAHGARQVLELGMVLAQEPHAVLLDEPTAGLTDNERHQIGDVLRQLTRDQGASIMLIEHDIDFVRRVADRIIVLDHGRVVASGSVAEVTASNLVREIYLGERVQ